MTSLNAAKLVLRDRGQLLPGWRADITVFDPARVKDRATYTEPFQYSEGIEYVLVNGQLVLDRGAHTGARPGRVLRHGTPVGRQSLDVCLCAAGRTANNHLRHSPAVVRRETFPLTRAKAFP